MAATEAALDDLDPDAAAPLGRRLLAEFMGTTLLVAVGAGVVTAVSIGAAVNQAAAAQAFGEDPVVGALVSNGPADLMPVAFAFAGVLALIVYALGGVSGGHFNPAVSLALAVVRRFTWKEVAPYWIAQILGGIVGAIVVAGIFGEAGVVAGTTDILYGATTYAKDLTFANAILSEAFITFLLMTAIMAVAVDPRAPKGFSGLVIGLSLAAGILVTANITGGSANFARSFGPFVASFFSGQFLDYPVGNIPWGNLLVYALGPVLGAGAAALLYEGVSGLEKFSPPPAPGAATGSPVKSPLDPGPETEMASVGASTSVTAEDSVTAGDSDTFEEKEPPGSEPPTSTPWPTRDS